jgi:hypothetical protein
MDVLGPLKECTKRLEGHGQRDKKDDDKANKPPGRFGSIAEVIPVFEHLLEVLESRLQSYEDVSITFTTKRLKTTSLSTCEPLVEVMIIVYHSTE